MDNPAPLKNLQEINWSLTTDEVIGTTKKKLLLNVALFGVAILIIYLPGLTRSFALDWLVIVGTIVLVYSTFRFFAYLDLGWPNKPTSVQYNIDESGIKITTPLRSWHISWSDIKYYKKYSEPKRYFSGHWLWYAMQKDNPPRMLKIYFNKSSWLKQFFIADVYIQMTSENAEIINSIFEQKKIYKKIEAFSPIIKLFLPIFLICSVVLILLLL